MANNDGNGRKGTIARIFDELMQAKVERAEIKTVLVGMEGSGGGLVQRVERNERRLNKLQLVQAGYTSIVGALAAFIPGFLKGGG